MTKQTVLASARVRANNNDAHLYVSRYFMHVLLIASGQDDTTDASTMSCQHLLLYTSHLPTAAYIHISLTHCCFIPPTYHQHTCTLRFFLWMLIWHIKAQWGQPCRRCLRSCAQLTFRLVWCRQHSAVIWRQNANTEAFQQITSY